MNIYDKIMMDGNDDGFEPPDPDQPTIAPPGTRLKFQVFCDRAAAGVSLWHNEDPVSWREMSAASMPILPNGCRNNGRKNSTHRMTE